MRDMLGNSTDLDPVGPDPDGPSPSRTERSPRALRISTEPDLQELGRQLKI
jgi:hypothetical protein